jgi:hypothetical protein
MIQSEPEDIEQIRARIRKMSDRELRQYGRAAVHMADPRKNHGNPNPSFQIQLDEARAEWRGDVIVKARHERGGIGCAKTSRDDLASRFSSGVKPDQNVRIALCTAC